MKPLTNKSKKPSDMQSRVHNISQMHVARVRGQGRAREYMIQQARRQPFSEYQPTPVYVTSGDEFYIDMDVGAPVEHLYMVIGVPELDTPQITPLHNGRNLIHATTGGLLSFINQAPFGHDINITVWPVKQLVPFFELNKTTHAAWEQQMAAYNQAPVVYLTSKKANIIVRYNSAKEHLDDPEKLMTYYDQVLDAQQQLSGITEINGRADYTADPNKLLYLEADRLYMFSANGHLGFSGSTALSLLLTTRDGWGPWHESGHQHQLDPFTWTNMVETTVNIYSLAAQEKLFGRASRLDERYPAVQEYFQSPDRSYDDETDHFIKVVMLWQLRLTFGEGFYPQLHQCYRRMTDLPPTEEAKKQRFIVETSKLANRSLVAFFEKWKIYPDQSTRNFLSDLPPLTLPIWETNAEREFPLSLPYPNYIPELSYCRTCIIRFSVSAVGFNFLMDLDWYSPYQYRVFINNTYVCEIANGIAYYCSGTHTPSGFYVWKDLPIAALDSFEIRVTLLGIEYSIIKNVYYSNALEESSVTPCTLRGLD